MDTTNERPIDLMADVDETQLREVFDRLHSLERQQSEAGRDIDRRIAELEKQAALDRKDFINSLDVIKTMLEQITNGETRNCMQHQSDLEAMSLRVDRVIKDLHDYKAERAKADKELSDAASKRSFVIWSAAIMAAVSLLAKAVPWIMENAIQGVK
jgi:hypothetical protein